MSPVHKRTDRRLWKCHDLWRMLKEQGVEMALMFHRRLAIPLWTIAFLTVAFPALPPTTFLRMSPTTLFVIVLGGIAVVVFASTDRDRTP